MQSLRLWSYRFSSSSLVDSQSIKILILYYYFLPLVNFCVDAFQFLYPLSTFKPPLYTIPSFVSLSVVVIMFYKYWSSEAILSISLVCFIQFTFGSFLYLILIYDTLFQITILSLNSFFYTPSRQNMLYKHY